jgi:protein TonB
VSLVMNAQGNKPWLDWVLVAAGALLLNLTVFGAASLLQREVAGGESVLGRAIQVFMPEDLPPPPEKKLEPPPKKEPPQTRLEPLKAGTPPKNRPDLQPPSLDLEINAKLTTGLNIAPPPALDGYGIADVDQGPMVKGRVPPMYPYYAKRQGIEGVVSVRFLVDKKGRVTKLSIIRAQPPNVFENAVRRSVVRWSFRPGYKDGEPVDTWVETDIEFKLEK